MKLNTILQRLDAMTSSNSQAGEFAATVAQQLRTMQDQITNATEDRLHLENQLHEAQQELAEARRKNARRKGEIEKQLEINRQYHELKNTPKDNLRNVAVQWRRVVEYLTTVPYLHEDAGLYTIQDVVEWCNIKLKCGHLTRDERKNMERAT